MHVVIIARDKKCSPLGWHAIHNRYDGTVATVMQVQLPRTFSRAGRDKGSFKSTNDKAHDNNKHATNNFDAGNTIIAQFMLDDRDVTLQWWCEEAGGRQTTYL
eukprot:scaffold18376_cov144-Skeletonema_marinoi.AAC.2